jgi:GNAT superfamily N-acetyltransferase
MIEIVRITQHSPQTQMAKLNELMLRTFDFSFEPWYSRGGWTDDYVCYTLFEGGRAAANVGVYAMDLLVRGAPKRSFQIGAVATHPDCRGRGLSRQVMQHVLGEYAELPAFLNADETVLDFYPRFGFRRADDRQPFINLLIDQPKTGLRPLSIDDPKVRQYLDRRASYSNLLDCTNAAPLNWFHLIQEDAHHIYEIPALNAMLVAEQEGPVLTLVDVISPGGAVAWDALVPQLGFTGVRTICFGFNPDWLGVHPQTRAYGPDSYFFVRGDLELPQGAIWPFLMRT